MKYFFPALCLFAIVFTSCKKEQDPFLISKHSIGLLTDSTQVQHLDVLFENDSIVKRIGGDEFIGRINDIEVFDTTGNALLVLTPKQSLDSTSTISTIKILDTRYKTEKGLHSKSTFGDIKKNYKISSIQNTLRNVVIFVNDINGFFTIDKKELPAELRFDMSKQIDALQIPEKAKIKYFMFGW